MKVITAEIIGYINLFENLTRARVKGCFQGNEVLVFVVYEGEAGRAIGKHGENIKRVGQLLKKRIKVVEFNNNPAKFVANFIFPIKAQVEMPDEKTVVIEGKGARFKEAVLGRERKNLKELQDIVSQYFNVEIKVQ